MKNKLSSCKMNEIQLTYIAVAIPANNFDAAIVRVGKFTLMIWHILTMQENPKSTRKMNFLQKPRLSC